MKNKFFILLLINLVIFGFNVDMKTRSAVCLELEALANCESPVTEEYGEKSKLKCFNDDGSEYSVPCCDFAPGYVNKCKGRKCHD